MEIFYLHQYFATPKGTTGTRSYEFAKRWVQRGHDVTVITTVSQLTENDLSLAKGRFLRSFYIDGVRVVAFSIPYSQEMGFIARVFSFLWFVFAAAVYVVVSRRPDITYASSTPLTVGLPALCGKLIRRIPYVFEVRDQWPEIPIELGIIRNHLLIRILLYFEKLIYRHAAAIIAASPGQAKGVARVAPPGKSIEIVPNCSDVDRFRTDIDATEVRHKHGWKNRFVLLHAGAMGKVNNLGFVLQAAEKLKDNLQIMFVLVGKGNETPHLLQTKQQKQLDNVQILPSVAKEKMPEYFAASDVSMVIIGNFPIVQHNSANKFFDSLAAGKPVLLNYSGWQRKVIEDNNAGMGCELANIDEFVSNVKKLYEDKVLREAMGGNARKLAENKFSRDILAQKVLNTLERVHVA